MIPKHGPIHGGNKIIVTGRDFQRSYNIICKFGKYKTRGFYINNHLIKCLVPKVNNPGKYRFSVSFKNGIFSGGNVFYTYFHTPEVSNIYPLCGPAEGSTQITITGKHFLKGLNDNK